MVSDDKYYLARVAIPLLSALVVVVSLFVAMQSSIATAQSEIDEIKNRYVGQKELALTLNPLEKDVEYNKKAIEKNGESLDRIEKANMEMLRYLKTNKDLR